MLYFAFCEGIIFTISGAHVLGFPFDRGLTMGPCGRTLTFILCRRESRDHSCS